MVLRKLKTTNKNTSKGKITVIHGPMFSGKTEELLRRVRRAKIARKKVQLFKPAIDNRYHASQVLPHFLANAGHVLQNATEKTDEGAVESIQVGEEAHVISRARDILSALMTNTNIVAVEEAQFLDAGLLDVLRRLTREGVDVILSLLDQDYRRLPFPIPESARTVGEYLAIAHESLKLAAICVVCGAEAHHSQKLSLVGINSAGEPEYAPASFHSEVVTVGTSQELTQSKLFTESLQKFPHDIYEARCRNCHIVTDEPL
ncbi:MAG: Thymidine kinase [Turneriella sp.]|nr:Thymidine kinase [Turneriella sp.]